VVDDGGMDSTLGACHAVPCCVFPLASFKWCRALPTTVNWKFYLPALGVWLEAQRAAAAGERCHRRCWPVGAAWESLGMPWSGGGLIMKSFFAFRDVRRFRAGRFGSYRGQWVCHGGQMK
jgi:hypothetical protein